MISDRLRETIFNRLYSELSRAEIIPYYDYVWFIDRENEFWYLRYDKERGRLLWRYDFFESFFSLFTFDYDEYTPILSSWVEEILNYKVNSSSGEYDFTTPIIDGVLNYEVSTTDFVVGKHLDVVEEILNNKK